MISIIICSPKKDIPSKVKTNIDKSIGIEYEIIFINNTRKKYSIFSAYNEGVHRAKYPYLCFMHDDVYPETLNWGSKVISYFDNNSIGLIGVIGTHFLPKTPSGWASPGIISGQIKNKDNIISRENHYMTSSIIEVVAVDGFWLCMPKKAFDHVRFDESCFNSFHCYDIDICLQTRKNNMKVCIVSDILIQHVSNGSWNMEWLTDTLKLFEKWENYLPQVAGIEISGKEVEIRTAMSETIFAWQKEYCTCMNQLRNIQNSTAYKLGKMIIKPLSKIYKLRNRNDS